MCLFPADGSGGKTMKSPLSFVRRAALCASVLVVALGLACSSGSGNGGANGASSGDAGEDSAVASSITPDDASSPAADALSPATDDGGSQGTDEASAPDLAPPPTLSAIAPTQAIVGTAGPTVTCTGAGFVTRSVIQVNGIPLTTS